MYEADLLRISLSLIAIILLIVAGGWLAKRTKLLRTASKKPLISVVERHSLGPRMHVVLIDSDGQKLLLGVTPQQINLLHHFDATDATSGSFQQHLQQHQHEQNPSS